MLFRQNLFWLPLRQIILSVIALFLLVLLAACNSSAPTAPNATIYVASRNGTVYTMNGKDGTIRWSHHLSGDNGSIWGFSEGLLLDNGVIYASSSVDGGYVYAFGAKTGTVLWHTQVHPQGLPSAVTLANGVIYLSVTDASLSSSHIYALKATNGSLLWSIQIKGCGSAPIIVSNSLFLNANICTGVGQQKGFVYALNTNNGSLRWQYQFGDTTTYQQPVVLGDVVYSAAGSIIYAIHSDKGSLLWQKNIRSNALSILVGVGNALYAGVDGSLYALRASDGKQLRQIQVGNHGPYVPSIIGNTVYAVSSFDPGIYAFRLQDGKPLWNYQSQDFSTGSSPIVYKGVVYFSMLNGTIYELAASDGTLIASYPITDSRLVTQSPLAVGQ